MTGGSLGTSILLIFMCILGSLSFPGGRNFNCLHTACPSCTRAEVTLFWCEVKRIVRTREIHIFTSCLVFKLEYWVSYRQILLSSGEFKMCGFNLLQLYKPTYMQWRWPFVFSLILKCVWVRFAAAWVLYICSSQLCWCSYHLWPIDY